MSGNLYAAVGELAGCRRLSEAFYARAAKDPVLKTFFPGSLRCAIEALTDYLAESLGGPAEYSKNQWWASLREAHARFKIGEREQDSWMRCMEATLKELAIDEPELAGYFRRTSAYLVGDGKAPDADHAVELIRKGEIPCLHGIDSSLKAKLLALMSGGSPALQEHVCAELRADPTLAHTRYSRERTLLHGAAEAGNAAVAGLLLELGADPNAVEEAGHTPLYRCANGSADVVRVLVHAGADVNHPCMPLHQAARRGNAEVVEALLDCGANINARDKRGDTPLQRALNCRKHAAARVLEAHAR